MQIEALPPVPAAATAEPSDRDLVAQLERSQIYHDYQKAFEATTGLPLTIRAVGSFQPPWHGSGKIAPFCALMARRNQSCSACLLAQERMEKEAHDQAVTFDCFAGLSDSAIPVRLGERVIGFLQTGQVRQQPASAAQFRKVKNQLVAWNSDLDIKKVEAAYFETRLVTRQQYDSILRLLAIFAQHLSSLSNELMVRESSSEVPAVVKARQFIAEHHADEISLADVARAAGMSSFYFCKIFRKATGLTYTEYLARVRIEHVKRALLNPNKRVSEAAYEAGFQSLSQFNRVFRRFAGESPSTYRDKLHGTAGAVATGASRLGRAA